MARGRWQGLASGGGRWTGSAVAAALMLCACGSASATQHASDTAGAVGAMVKDLAAGRLDALPTGTAYIQVNSFAQGAGDLIGSKKHVPGIIMQETGVQRLEVDGSPPLEIRAGEAAFLPSVTHAHLNPGPDANHWFNFALWPSSARSAPLTSPTAAVKFTTPDLPASALPQGSYDITLQMVTLPPHGRTDAHAYGGVSVVFVLSGSVSAHIAGQSAATIGPESAAWALPDTGLQVFDDGDQPASFLAFVIAQVGRPFETALTQSP